MDDARKLSITDRTDDAPTDLFGPAHSWCRATSAERSNHTTMHELVEAMKAQAREMKRQGNVLEHLTKVLTGYEFDEEGNVIESTSVPSVAKRRLLSTFEGKRNIWT